MENTADLILFLKNNSYIRYISILTLRCKGCQ